MIRHQYSGWTLYKGSNGYIAERNADQHVAPEAYPRLMDAKQAIDDGSASLTALQHYARIARADALASPDPVAYLQSLAEAGSKPAALALRTMEGAEALEAVREMGSNCTLHPQLGWCYTPERKQ